jgi:hypothetical protein
MNFEAHPPMKMKELPSWNADITNWKHVYDVDTIFGSSN